VSQSARRRVVRVSADTVELVAGSGRPCLRAASAASASASPSRCGDGQRAVDAALSLPKGASGPHTRTTLQRTAHCSWFHFAALCPPSVPMLLASTTCRVFPPIDVKNVFTFFILVTFFTFYNVFLFSKRFFIFKNVGKVQSGKHINKKHFQNNSNEIDL